MKMTKCRLRRAQKLQFFFTFSFVWSIVDTKFAVYAHARILFLGDRGSETLIMRRASRPGPGIARANGTKWTVLEKIMARAMRECKRSRWKACRALSGILRIPCVPSLKKRKKKSRRACSFVRQMCTRRGRFAVVCPLPFAWREFCVYIVITVMSR